MATEYPLSKSAVGDPAHLKDSSTNCVDLYAVLKCFDFTPQMCTLKHKTWSYSIDFILSHPCLFNQTHVLFLSRLSFTLPPCQSGRAVCVSALLTAMTKPSLPLRRYSRASYGAYWLISCRPHRSPRLRCWLLTNGPTIPRLPPSIILSLCSLPLWYFPTSLLSFRPA